MWRRALAFVIDLTPLLVLAVVENVAGVADSEVIGFLNLAVLIGYFAGMNYWYGGTVGKRMMGLRVALPNAPDVRSKLAVRALVKLFCIAPPQATIYGLIAIWRKDGRSLADFCTSSTVVNAGTLSPLKPLSLPGKLFASFVILVAPIFLMLALIIFVFAAFGEWKIQ